MANDRGPLGSASGWVGLGWSGAREEGEGAAGWGRPLESPKTSPDYSVMQAGMPTAAGTETPSRMTWSSAP
jgi:hypothetical protein